MGFYKTFFGGNFLGDTGKEEREIYLKGRDL
jgi:hypothetical protein